MRLDKLKAFTYVCKDEKRELCELRSGFEAIWDVIGGDDLPEGLDYFMFDSALTCSSVAACKWLELVTGNSICPITYHGAIARSAELGAEVVISGLELFRRRRLKADPDWQRLGVEWSNRCTRAKTRALKMVEQHECEALCLVATG